MPDENPPDPLTAADCDLRGLEYMPLAVVRLRDSDMAAIEDPEAFRCAVLLWCAAWHQVPAASLPDDEAKLTRLAGYGRDIKSFRAARKAGGLRGWVLCSDGRWYHPVVAEKATEAMRLRRAFRQKTAAATAARQKLLAKEAPPQIAQPPEKVAEQFDVTKNVTTHVTRTNEGNEGNEGNEVSSRGRTKVRRSDPPQAWSSYSRKFSPDPRGVSRAEVAGYYLDLTAETVCTAARIPDEDWPGDWETLAGWLRAGFNPDTQIVPVIARIASRPSYRPPSTLAYFSPAVREQAPSERPS